ncbi:outer dynein arm-docking complex subunit 3-like [Lineus longissimus]|uniref:outer dynein arm-docking complex subunit 3-like n=1 Tax=Lineus longissimus TaxID=88925 RepID=UPI00315D3322
MSSGDTARVVWEGWTTKVKDRLNEVRGKLKLKEFDHKVHYEWTEDERRRNEEVLIGLRQDVRSRRFELKRNADCIDSKVINNVFQDRREKRMSLQRFTAKEAVTEMDQLVCAKAKFLNALHYARVTSEEKLRQFKAGLVCMSSAMEKTSEQLENEQRIRNLENALDKARMKCDMGRSIGHQYEFIVKKMKEESLCYPGKLDVMENEIMYQRGQLKEMRRVLKVARDAREVSREELTTLEQDCQGAKRKRDQLLVATRKEVEQRKSTWDEKPPANSKRAIKALDNMSSVESHDCTRVEAEKIAVRNRRFHYDDIFERIKDETYLTSLHDFIDRIEQQEDVRRRLTEKTIDLRKNIDFADEDRQKLQDDRSKLRYAVGGRISSAQNAMSQFFDNIHQQQERKEYYQEELHMSGRLITDVKTVILGLMAKLKAMKLKPDVRNYSHGDVVEDLETCREKMVLLTEGVDQSLAKIGLEDSIQKVIMQPEYHVIRLEQLADNIRKKLSTSFPSISAESYEYDTHDINEEMLSRNDIKRIAQAVVDSKTKHPKKNKNKRK